MENGLQQLLTNIGLTKYEIECYKGMLELGIVKAKELCKQTGVPYGRIYDVLQQLAEKGLISVIPTKPKSFKVIDPKLAFALALQKKEEELKHLRQSLSGLEFKQPEVHRTKDSTVVLRGKEQQFEIVRHFHRTVKKELMSISRNFNPDVAYKTAIRQALQRKVSMRVIIRALMQKNKEFITECVDNGAEFREKELSGLRLVIKDREEMLLSIVEPKTNDRFSIYTNNKEFVSSMAVFFNTLWNSSKSSIKRLPGRAMFKI